MMDFIMMTISFTVGILLASVVALVLMMQPKVVKWYMKLMIKYTKAIAEFAEEEMTKDL